MRASWIKLSSAVLVILAATAHGRTWTVELDGSGAFTVIQDAVDAASDGDVIAIGPGRFDDFQTVYNNDGHPLYDVYVKIEAKSLTLIGAGQEQTIIGPADGSIHTRQSMGIMAQQVNALTLRDLVFEHTNFHSVHFEYGHLDMNSCVIRSADVGIFAIASDGGSVRSCRFESIEDDGLIVYTPTPLFELSDCQFQDVGLGAGAYWSGARCDIVRCSFTNGVVATGFSNLACGSVVDCTMTNCANYALAVHGAQSVAFTDNTVVCDSGSAGLGLLGCNELTVVNNVIEGGNFACLYANAGYGDLSIHQNHFLRMDGGYFARTTTFFPYADTIIDLSGNYWGTTNIDEIELWTLDGDDLPNSNLFFNFEPIAEGPVSTEQTTWGEVKTLFR